MSDASQGPGWWQASDGKWYPPEAKLPPPPPGAYAAAPAPAGRSAATIVAIVVGAFVVATFLIAFLSILAITFLGRSTGDKLSRLGEVEESAPAVVTPISPSPLPSSRPTRG